MTVGAINPGHEDLIHDISFDYYGSRFATCSSDQKIKVFEISDTDWTLNDSWKAHDAAILRVCWAHPEYGQLIASSSFDKSVRIFEEQESEAKCSEKRWTEKARLVDSRGTVQDIEFAPNHLGLKLVLISIIRVNLRPLFPLTAA
jgi:nucleoporin SEH1